MGDALAALRRFNHERIYLRPESIAQADTVISLLRALVEHYVSHPENLPGGSPSGDDPLLPAVAYVDGMTDRFACSQAVSLLKWPAGRLPRGQDVGYAQ
jgi:dGTPase